MAGWRVGWWRAAGRTLAAIVMAAGGPAVQAAEIRVMAANAVREPLLEIVAAFERSTGHTVRLTWSGTAGIVKRVADGERVDLVIVGSEAIDRLVSEGRLRAEGRADVAKSGVGIAVGPGLSKPDISSADAVKAAILQARSVAYSSGPSGIYMAELFKRLGVDEQVKAKLVRPPPSVQIGDLLARGEVELGFQQISDLLPVKGIQFVGPLPAAIQNMTVYRGALHPSAPSPEAAKALLDFVVTPASWPAIRKAGMEPG